MKEVILTKSNFDQEVLKATGIVLVDFWASWCGPCMMLSPVIEEIANEGKIKVGKVNVDDEMALAVQYGIEVIPTLIFFKDGQKVKQTSGLMDKADIEKIIAAL